MKIKVAFLAFAVTVLALSTSVAQPPGMGRGPGGPPPGPRFDGVFAKIFEQNPNFSADMEFHTTAPSGQEMTMPGKIAFQDGKSRFEMDMTEIKGMSIPPQAMGQMKAMGMDKIVAISRPDLKTTYQVFPGMQGYIESPLPDSQAGGKPSDYKADVTKLGEETIDGHVCDKSKYVVTDKDGQKHEATVWVAKDLKGFPLKVESSENGTQFSMTLKDVKTEKPGDAQFEAPSGYKKASSMMELMMSHMPQH